MFALAMHHLGVLVGLSLLVPALVFAHNHGPQLPHPADPFADPKGDPYNPLGYIASDTLAAVAFSLYPFDKPVILMP